jgi:hypothetical protein
MPLPGCPALWPRVTQRVHVAKDNRNASEARPWAAWKAEVDLEAWDMAATLQPVATTLRLPFEVLFGHWEPAPSDAPLSDPRGMTPLRARGLWHLGAQPIDRGASEAASYMRQGAHRLMCLLGQKANPPPASVDLPLLAGFGQVVGTLSCRSVDAAVLGVGLGVGAAYGSIRGIAAARACRATLDSAYASLCAGLGPLDTQALKSALNGPAEARDALVLQLRGCVMPTSSLQERQHIVAYLQGLAAVWRDKFIRLRQTHAGEQLIRATFDRPECNASNWQVITQVLQLRDVQRESLLYALSSLRGVTSQQAVDCLTQILSRPPGTCRTFIHMLEFLGIHGYSVDYMQAFMAAIVGLPPALGEQLGRASQILLKTRPLSPADLHQLLVQLKEKDSAGRDDFLRAANLGRRFLSPSALVRTA